MRVFVLMAHLCTTFLVSSLMVYGPKIKTISFYTPPSILKLVQLKETVEFQKGCKSKIACWVMMTRKIIQKQECNFKQTKRFSLVCHVRRKSPNIYSSGNYFQGTVCGLFLEYCVWVIFRVLCVWVIFRVLCVDYFQGTVCALFLG